MKFKRECQNCAAYLEVTYDSFDVMFLISDHQTPTGYVKTTLVNQVQLPNSCHNNTPQHAAFMSPDTMRDTPSVASRYDDIFLCSY